MKKILVICLIIVIVATSCSMFPRKAIDTEVRWTFNYDDINSIIDSSDKIVVVSNTTYYDTVMKKHSGIPKTFYKVGKLYIVDKKSGFAEDFEKELRTTDGSVQLGLSCGTLTEMEYYELEAKDSNIKKNRKKPSFLTANRPILMGLGDYIELDKDAIYLVMANYEGETNTYYTNVYTIFKYNASDHSFVNKTSGLSVKVSELNSIIVK